MHIYIYIYIYIATPREMGGAPRKSGSQEPLFGADCQTIGLPLRRWALDRQSFR